MITNYKMKMLLQTQLHQKIPVFLLGIDLGTKFVGFAKANLKEKTTEILPAFFSSAKSVYFDQKFHKYLLNLLKSNKINAIIVGSPIEYEETQIKFHKIIENILKKNEINQPITEVAESCTTIAASKIINILKSQRQMENIRQNEESVDSMSAVLILQNFMRYFYNE